MKDSLSFHSRHKSVAWVISRLCTLWRVTWCAVFSGMVDIARQTVEFLYEENGGIPRDLYLPTIEDIKDEANKFTIDKVRKGFAFLLTTLRTFWMKRTVGFS